MAATPDTQPSLLVRLRDERDGESWSRFVGIYAPVIYGFLVQKGIQDADAADLTQDVMASVASSIHSFEYQPNRGRFRGWLFTVTQNRLRNHWRSVASRAVAKGDSQSYQLLLEQPDSSGADGDKWDHEYERHLFAAATERVRPQVQEGTWLAFWATAIDGESPKSVGIRLSMSPAAVRLAKARVLARIKREVQAVEGESP
ncbi:MAG: sigma-70 family RNA polymerase sigma factor [Planctomycetota bacterium]